MYIADFEGKWWTTLELQYLAANGYAVNFSAENVNMTKSSAIFDSGNLPESYFSNGTGKNSMLSLRIEGLKESRNNV